MEQKAHTGEQEEVKPDILIPYTLDRETLADSSMAIICVRPETNQAKYEAEIIKATAKYADVVYLANLSGRLINEKAIVASHYSSQMQFAINGKEDMAWYPEMIEKFEQKFNIAFKDAPIIGSFDAILHFKLKKDGDELFETMVPRADFLEMYGQTIKKIENYYVLNYDIPAIITKHHNDTGMFIIAIRFKDNKYKFCDLHHLIYENMYKNENTQFIDSDKRKGMAWYNKVRRTYHISRSHIEAMFDLTDYVFKNDNQRIEFSDTPLGQRLLKDKVFEKGQLQKLLIELKDNPLVYIKEKSGEPKLVDIILEGKKRDAHTFIENDLIECSELIKSIYYS
ncbi:MAG: hypothetical protein GY757_23710 [bacterium]|nr:hypothetical protein [bacterium]